MEKKARMTKNLKEASVEEIEEVGLKTENALNQTTWQNGVTSTDYVARIKLDKK